MPGKTTQTSSSRKLGKICTACNREEPDTCGPTKQFITKRKSAASSKPTKPTASKKTSTKKPVSPKKTSKKSASVAKTVPKLKKTVARKKTPCDMGKCGDYSSDCSSHSSDCSCSSCCSSDGSTSEYECYNGKCKKC
ncbi:unnamed protein product [Diabrotica balteata]|uniref:Uncharacterized protein n=1 Tax=Diabrotica balteata TaxID=107213 RepID=A0A9N9T7Z1_DIABA|nr:unnamed protein product [Diabrotica balteata]